MNDMPLSWLTSPIDINVAESLRVIDFIGFDENDVVDKNSFWMEPFLPTNKEWQTFKSKLGSHELWRWKCPMAPLNGFAIVENGHIVDTFLVRVF